MASITQTIPNYNGGISQQPDELKVPGQVKDALNVIPDLTHGLLKRPGGKLIASLSDSTPAALNSNTNGKWFHYYRDENEQYIGQVSRAGDINIWRCSDGNPMTVNYDSGAVTALTNYLTHTADADIQTLTLNDYTYITNRTKKVEMSSTIEPTRPKEAYIELKKVAYASQYALNLYDSLATTDTYTATRIKVEREVDSSNGCDTGSGAGSAGDQPPSGTLHGSTNYTNRCTAGSFRDSLCPNVATEIFAVNHGDSGDITDSNDATHIYEVTVGSNEGLPADRKNLYFRITTTGQAVPQGSGDSITYHCRYTTTHDLLYGGEGWRTGDYFYLWMKDSKYKITIEDHSQSQVQVTMGGDSKSGLIRPIPTPFYTETTVTAESILGDIRAAIVDQSNGLSSNDVVQIGNGLYINNGTTESDAFNVNTPVGELLNVFTDSIEDVADLPRQCRDGYVVRVANSAADEDDYYLKFFGNNGRDGEGVWEECPKPGRKVEFDKATMPIQLIREADQSFTVKQITWDNCPVGDTTTVPEPSFVGNKITKMLFWRNRLALLSDENINLSRPGSFFHYWPKSAVTYTATDNIDISCSSEYPAIVYDGIQVNQGLVLFTKNQQFMLTTDSDVLSSQTAKINAVSTYNFNSNTNPISLGTTVGFFDNGGKNTRFFEMSNVVREGAPDVIEQSKVVSKLLPKDITLVANSRENSVIFFGTKGKNEVFGYRYFSSIEKRIQNSWFRWTVSGDVQHMAMLDDALYVVIRNGTKDVLQKFSIKLDEATSTIVDDLGTDETTDDLTYRLHLDNAKAVAHTSLTYEDTGVHEGYTTFPIPDGFNNTTGKLHAIAIPTTADKTFQGMSAPAYTYNLDGNTRIKMLGNWKTYDPQALNDANTSDDITPPGNIILGYTFDMEVKFPTVYVVQSNGENFRSQINGSLVLHRVKFSFGPLGVYETKLQRVGKPDYIELYESIVADSYLANRVQFTSESQSIVPIYEKNVNLTLSLKSTHPSPATLYSMTWEGDYTPKYYKRV